MKKLHLSLVLFCILLFNSLNLSAQNCDPWNWIANVSPNSLYSVYFTSTDTGYVVGYGGKISKTTNGGSSWVSQISGTSDDLRSIYFVNKDTGYIVGGPSYSNYTYSTILKTVNGGTVWTSYSIAGQGVQSIFFVNNNIGYAAGGKKIYKTNNGGITWTSQSIITSNYLRRIYFTDVNNGYAVGDNGEIWKTINGGINWISKTSGTTSDLNSVNFPNTDTGYIVGNSGKILKTTNGGNNWILQSSGTTNVLNSVFFFDANNGFACGNSGKILKTSNGGLNWISQISGTSATLNEIYFNNFNTGYVVGSYGYIFKTEHGSEPAILKAIVPEGIIQRCMVSDTTTYTTSAVNATSYVWDITPASAGVISGNGTTATVIWNPSFTGNSTISVYGTNGTCNGQSDSLVVTTVTNLTGSFSLNSPTNGAYSSSTPLLSWAASSGTNYYRLYVDGVLKKNNINTNSYQIQSNEAISQGMHTWYVTAGGCPVHSNETWSIMVDAILPNVFNLVLPDNYSWTSNLTPTLSWSSSSDANSGLSKYQLWIDSTLNRDNIPISSSSTSPISSLTNGIHTWMIKAIDNVGNIRNSSQTFIIKVDNIPPVCNLKYPLNNQYISSSTPTLTWSTTDSGSGFQRAQLYIDGTLINSNITDSLWIVTNPLSYGIHTWYVKVYDSLNNNQVTNLRTFYVDNVMPNAFNLTNPTNNQIVNLPTPNLSWQTTTDSIGGGGLTKYQLWINGIKNQDSIPISQTTVAPSYALTQGVYTWNIRAYDIAGNYRQSNQTWSFFVDWEPPTAFNLIEPLNNSVTSLTKPIFKWHPSSDLGSGLLKYELCISGQTPIIILPSDTSNHITFDLVDGTYTWYVKAYDKAGSITISNTFTIIINTLLPGQASVPFGPNELCFNPSNSTYTTTGAANATSYIWILNPINAGNISGTGLNGTVIWNNTFIGSAQITVLGHNNVGDGITSTPLNVLVHPATNPGSVYGGSNICLGSSTSILTLNGYVGKIIKWQKKINNGTWFDISDTTSIYMEVPTSIGVWAYRACVKSGNCDSLFSDSTLVNVGDIPSNAGIITGLITTCQGQNTVIYTVPIIANATTYNWSLPPGATGISNSNSINVNYGYSATSGSIYVNGSNACGNGALSTLAINVNPLPIAAGTISGLANVCQGQNAVNYTVPIIANANSYIWTLPTGATGSSTTNTITVNYGTAAVSGNITVKGNNNCGDGVLSTLAININPLPIAAGTISGLATVCQGQNAVNYTVPIITNATSYIWSLPSGAVDTSIINTITVNYPTSALSGNITVKGYNSCGTGDSAYLAVTVNPLPGIAGNISGLASVCQEQASVTYNVPTVSNATSYIWTLPSGVSGTSNTNSITVNYSTSAVSANITVKGSNSCGIGDSSLLAITVNPLPFAAGLITSINNDSVSINENNVLYSVPYILNATTYEWIYSGLGATFAGGNITTTNNITINFSPTATSGNLTVKGYNSCGDGVVSSNYPIYVSPVGIIENTQNTQLHFYPNPATNSLTLNLGQLQKLQNVSLSIYDIRGKQLLHQNISHAQTQIDISSFAKGIYIVRVQTDKETLQSKFVKE